jgi:tetratricopeptide (TPR) repeat protein
MIYTFYAYKGGVGRSMALANIAELLYARGLSVLMIDWDLEAPGLERYFPVDLETALEQHGVSDLITSYKRLLASPYTVSESESESPPVLELPDITRYMLDIYPGERGAGKLRLMPAGRRSKDNFDQYGGFVRTFGWEDFYQNWEGEAFLEWFRQQVNGLADVVLVDSRTGVTEIGGICTYQLADAIVMFCGSHAQSIDGTFSMATGFKDPHVVELRHGRPLDVLVVPARVEDRAEAGLLRDFQKDFLHRFGRNSFFADRALAASPEDMWELRIPHVPFYSFRETVMVREAAGVRHPDMYTAFTRITASLANVAPKDSPMRQAGEAGRGGLAAARVRPRIVNAPPRSRNFIGREVLLQQIEGALADPEQNVEAVALTGLGGVGKTSLAAEYVHRHLNDYDVVWWIRADDEAALRADYGRLAEALRLPEASSSDPRDAFAAVHRWLEHNPNWLLVVDNASDTRAVAAILPPAGAGHAIITSRNPGWQAIASVLPVDVLSPADSAEFLLKNTRDTDADAEAARTLADALGYLPLALEQAASYVEETGMGLPMYLELFDLRSAELLVRESSIGGTATVATTWQMSFERLRTESPAGAAVLRLCAFMAPDDIPLDVFQVEAVQHAPVPWPDELETLARDPIAMADALAALRRYSLIAMGEDSLSVHRLVQAVVRQQLDERALRDWAGLAVLFLAAIFPEQTEDVGTWPRCGRLLPHAISVTGHAEQAGVLPDEVVSLLDRAAAYLRGRAEFTMAKRCLERALALVVAYHGPADPSLCGILTRLGDVLSELGDLKAAEKRYRQALAAAESSYAPDDPQMAAIFISLGRLLRILGRFGEATAALQRALAISQQVDGPDHRGTANALCQLGRVFSAQGRLTEAADNFARALEITEAAYGPGHPEVATALANLGRVVAALGRFDEARSDFERALAIVEATYGPDHPSVSPILDDLGKVLCELGRPGEARARHERALTIDEQAYGPAHLNVAADHRNLGTALCELGDLGSARAHLEQALAINETALGEWHPGLAGIRNELGRVLREYGDLDGAREQFERALTVLRHNALSDHPDAASALTNLGRVLSQLGDLDAARATLEEALLTSERLYGASHPDVAAALANLGRVLEQLREFERAKDAYERALEIGTHVYGPDHPNVADYLDHLGLARDELGDAQAAQRNIEQAVRIFEGSYGPRHPSVAVALVHLGGVLSHQGYQSAAELQLRRALEIWRETYGPGHPSAVRTRELLEQLLRRVPGDGEDNRPGHSAQLSIRTASDHDAAGNADQTRLLHDALLTLDVDAIDPVRVEDAPGGTKCVALSQPGLLTVLVSRSPETLRAVLGMVSAWLRQKPGSKSVKIELARDVLELSPETAGQREQLIESWIARNSRQA